MDDRTCKSALTAITGTVRAADTADSKAQNVEAQGVRKETSAAKGSGEPIEVEAVEFDVEAYIKELECEENSEDQQPGKEAKRKQEVDGEVVARIAANRAKALARKDFLAERKQLIEANRAKAVARKREKGSSEAAYAKATSQQPSGEEQGQGGTRRP